MEVGGGLEHCMVTRIKITFSFEFPPTVQEGSLYSTPSPAIDTVTMENSIEIP